MDHTSNPDSVSGTTRRQFIKQAATVTAAAAATSLFKTPVYGQNQAPSTGRVIGANDRIVIGYIGVGAQGTTAHVTLQKKNAAMNNIAQAAVCDVWPKRCEDAKKLIEDGTDAKVEMFGDYHKLLERKDLDAVVVATHDPHHAPATMAAVDAGKHVYCEKPMTRYLGEAFAVYDKVKASGKIVQIGSQGCTAQGWHKAKEMILAGKIGQLVWAQGYYCRNSVAGEWNINMDDSSIGHVDWEKWLGQVKNRGPFDMQHYFRWRKFYPYCAGLLGDLMPHRLHPLMLAMGNTEFPVRVNAVGTRNVHADLTNPGTPERSVPEHIELLAEFPSGVSLMLACSTVNSRSPGFTLYGHKASLEIGTSGERIQMIPEKDYADEIEPDTIGGLQPIEDIAEHHKNWFESIRQNKQPNCNVDLAIRVQTVITLAEMSDRLKITCLFDEKTRKITTGDGKEVPAITYGTLPLS